jgi:hypothetical protein
VLTAVKVEVGGGCVLGCDALMLEKLTELSEGKAAFIFMEEEYTQSRA